QDAAVIIDRDYRLQNVNPAFEQLWKMPVEKAIGATVADIVGRVAFEQGKALMDRCFAGEHVNDARWIDYSIGRRYRSITYSPLRLGSERVEAVLAITRDLSEHMLAIEALRESQDALARANRATTLGMLGASIAHEVNQPLGAIATS